MNKNASRILLSATMAGILGGVVALPPSAHAGNEVKCYGVNECKGKSACHTATNGCKGQNGCKGKGYLEMDKKECKKKGGSVDQPKA